MHIPHRHYRPFDALLIIRTSDHTPFDHTALLIIRTSALQAF